MLNMIQKNSRLTNYAKTYFEGVINQFVLALKVSFCTRTTYDVHALKVSFYACADGNLLCTRVWHSFANAIKLPLCVCSRRHLLPYTTHVSKSSLHVMLLFF